MTDKQKKIQEAYGRFYDAERHHYSINGWTNPEHYSEKEMEEMMQEINMEFGEYRCRPKSLSGIENNNGWIKIKSIKDLPKENCNCFVVWGDGEISIENFDTKDQFQKKMWSEELSHYKPIEIPNPPIY